jgi:hypothetical protein
MHRAARGARQGFRARPIGVQADVSELHMLMADVERQVRGCMLRRPWEQLRDRQQEYDDNEDDDVMWQKHQGNRAGEGQAGVG